ncbi:MAG: flagellar hook-length control protein FliK [Halorhodospira sp.]
MTENRCSVLIRFPEASGRPEFALHLGDTLQARARWVEEGLVLLVGEHRLPARANLPVADGDRLVLRVSGLGHPLTLQVIDHLGPRPSLERTLRQALPRQATAADLAAAAYPQEPLTPEGFWHPSCQKMRDALPTAAELATPAGLRQAVVNAGLFLEARLARGEDTQRDLKGHLHACTAALQPPPTTATPPSSSPPATAPPLAPMLEGLLLRIQALQARLALSPPPPATSAWGIDLPVRTGDALNALRLLVQPASGNRKRSATWTVQAHLLLHTLGPVYVTLHLQGHRVDTAWWAERRDSAEHLAAALPALEERLRAAALEPGALTCYHGSPAQDATAPQATATAGMIDERA